MPILYNVLRVSDICPTRIRYLFCTPIPVLYAYRIPVMSACQMPVMYTVLRVSDTRSVQSPMRIRYLFRTNRMLRESCSAGTGEGSYGDSELEREDDSAATALGTSRFCTRALGHGWKVFENDDCMEV
eukprot:1628923-Rhodomonas_salina.2